MERVYRVDLTVHDSVPVPPHEGPGPPAGPGEAGPRGGAAGHQGDGGGHPHTGPV